MRTDHSLCPSAEFELNGEVVFGMVGGSAQERRVIYLRQAVPIEQVDISRLNGITPGEVFRVAGTCAKDNCAHHDGDSQQCSLVNRIVEKAPVVTSELAYCAIRHSCVWWGQHGRSACERCSQVVSRDLMPSEELAEARIPPNRQNISSDINTQSSAVQSGG
ncbi:hypothetical protein [Chromobacterium sp. IIBBL 290-4]|uniref:hypothetical protein n=1 Tax=Chromobacterium sp. IIBBL 290-4 TaxID=2953890 RepID=UPI0020B7300D|nr:hypothetical protein [Chromobacterium sp. IIBBL 290-4]UTH75782.1 hypothetical protein NKT35_06690 [Chromobacterium sp. IIBBL 290-4]